MRKSLMKKYAQAVVRFGANVKKGQFVLVNCSTEQAQFASYLAEEAYKAKASYVRVQFYNDQLDRLTVEKAKYEGYMQNAPITIGNYQVYSDLLPVMIHVVDSDPDLLNGLDLADRNRSRRETYPQMKPFIDKMDNRYQWVICAMPSMGWAKKVFPNDKPKDAYKKLEEAILKTTRIDSNATANWKEHVAQLQSKAALLNELNLKALHYTASNGTDLLLQLMPNHCWLSAREKVLGKKNVEFTANMPTEEVFTMPKPDGVDGVVYSSKPLSFRGKLIEDFHFRFEKGKVVEVYAKANQQSLEELISDDEGSSRLGEVALVPYDSPISQSNILFYNTLFDENASCHLALGESFKNCLKDYENITDEQWKEMGFNESMNHVDFMVGTKDLNITGIRQDGSEIQIFKDGNWAF